MHWAPLGGRNGSSWGNLVRFFHGLGASVQPWHQQCTSYLVTSLFIFNQQLQFNAEAWNQHKLQIRGGPNRSPANLFGFDMMVYGRGDSLPEEEMSNEGIEIYGVNWEVLSDNQLLHSQGENNSTNEGSTSWIGWTGSPQHLNKVPLYPPSSDVLTSADLQRLSTHGMASQMMRINFSLVTRTWICKSYTG